MLVNFLHRHNALRRSLAIACVVLLLYMAATYVGYYFVRYVVAFLQRPICLLFGRYFVSGLVGTTVFYPVYYTLTEVYGHEPGNAMRYAFWPTFLVKFLVQKFWSFRHMGLVAALPQLVLLLAKYLAFLELNVACLRLLIEHTHIWHLFLQIFLMCSFGFLSFGVSCLIFRFRTILVWLQSKLLRA